MERIIRWLVQFQMAIERDPARLERADAVKKAIESIECEGLSLREASAQATTTLFKHRNGRVHHTSVGKPTALSEVEEKIIARFIIAYPWSETIDENAFHQDCLGGSI